MSAQIETWLQSLAGGMLIGLAAATYLWLNGRIAGVSGLLGGLLAEHRPLDWRERVLMLAGLVGGSLLCVWLLPGTQVLTAQSTLPLTAVAGLLVGIGTRMGNGCTSGHGICGLARLSPRSLIAVMTFMATGVMVAFLLRQLGVRS